MGAGLAADRWRGVADCCGSTAAATQDVQGRLCPKPAAVLPPALLPAPSGEERAADGARADCKPQMALDRRRDDANVAQESLPVKRMSADYIRAMPTLNLANDELAAVTAAILRAIEDDRFPHSPRLDPLRAALGNSGGRRAERAPEGPAASQSRQAGAARTARPKGKGPAQREPAGPSFKRL